jgi:hypothetical protein
MTHAVAMRSWIIEEYTEHSRKLKVTLGPKADPAACLILSATICDNQSPNQPAGSKQPNGSRTLVAYPRGKGVEGIVWCG